MSFEEAQKQGGNKGVNRFLKGDIEIIKSGQNFSNSGRFKGVIEFNEPEFALISTKINQHNLNHLGFGYAGVMSPDGKLALHLTADLSKYKPELGLTPPQKMKELSALLGVPVNPRQSSHSTLARVAFPNNTLDDLLWGFAINQKGDKNVIEIGFMSGQVNKPRGIGVGGSARRDGILNRTDQKKLVDFLQNYLDKKFGSGTYVLEPKPPRRNSDNLEVEYY